MLTFFSNLSRKLSSHKECRIIALIVMFRIFLLFFRVQIARLGQFREKYNP